MATPPTWVATVADIFQQQKAPKPYGDSGDFLYFEIVDPYGFGVVPGAGSCWAPFG